MSRFFGKKCNLTIGSKSQTFERIFNEEFKINFSVRKNIDAKSVDSANITLFNTADSLYNSLISVDDAYVRIEAGYPGNFGVVYEGDIMTVNLDPTSVDKKLMITAGDGDKAINQTRLTKNYNLDINLKTIAKDLVDAMKTTGGIIVSGVANSLLLKLKGKAKAGKNISGPASINLEKILQKAGLKYIVSNNELFIYADDTAIDSVNILLTPETGLLGSPSIKRTEKGRKGKKTIVEGVNFKSFIQPGLIPGRSIEINSRYINGQYIVQDTTITGDTYGGEWSIQGFAV